MVLKQDLVLVQAITEGEAVIFQPDGQEGFTLVTRLKPEAWNSLAP
jgi:hypothetical protein